MEQQSPPLLSSPSFLRLLVIQTEINDTLFINLLMVRNSFFSPSRFSQIDSNRICSIILSSPSSLPLSQHPTLHLSLSLIPSQPSTSFKQQPIHCHANSKPETISNTQSYHFHLPSHHISPQRRQSGEADRRPLVSVRMCVCMCASVSGLCWGGDMGGGGGSLLGVSFASSSSP